LNSFFNTCRDVMRGKEKGYTVLEMAVVIGVTGMILASAASAWRLYSQTGAHSDTTTNLDQATAALDDYLVRLGRLPCPARLDLPRTDPNYGMEGQCDPTQTAAINPANPYPTAINPGDCKGGICLEKSLRTDPRPAGIPVAVSWPPAVRRGMLPFRILNLPEELAYDGYHTRLQYAVTEPLAVSSTYNETYGGIQVNDSNNAPLFNLAKTGARYLVFSSGKDSKGAYNKMGSLIAPCDMQTVDGENCNTSSTNTTAIYRLGQTATAAGAQHFDDVMKFYSTNNAPLWRPTSPLVGDITDMLDAKDSTAGAFAIGRNPVKYTLEVKDKVHADGNLDVSELCDNSDATKYGANCFLPSKIGGQDAYMDCTTNPDITNPAMKYATGVYGGTHKGTTSCTSSPVPAVCPDGQFVTSIDNAGKITCSTGPGCPSITVNQCSGVAIVIPTTVGLPQHPPAFYGQNPYTNDPNLNYDDESTQWQYQWTSANTMPGFGGPLRTDTYYCKSNAWTYYSTKSLNSSNLEDIMFPPAYPCQNPVCTPTSVTIKDSDKQPIPCSQFYGNSHLTGEVTDYIHTTSCPPSAQDTWRSVAETCTCKSDKTDVKKMCSDTYGPNALGAIEATMSYICDSPTTGHTETELTAGSCTCTPGSNVETRSCGTGYSGSTTWQQDFTCDKSNVGTWSAWTETADKCVCNKSGLLIDGPYTQSCASGYTGSKVVQRPVDCSSDSPSIPYPKAWQTISDTCTCDPTAPAAHQQQAVTCQSINGPGWGGTVLQTQDFDCKTNTWSEWTNAQDPSVACVKADTTWFPSGGSEGPTTTDPNYPAVGSSCAKGAIGVCEELQSGGFITYFGCTCQ
jgi:type II secretory pathway pseudopilin PulG